MADRKRRSRRGTLEQLVADLQRVAQETGTETVTQKEYEGAGEFSVDAISKTFGTWNEGLKAAGLGISRRNWATDACLRAIGTVVRQLGCIPTYGQYKEVATGLGLPCVSSIEKHMKGWSPALQAYQSSPFAISPSSDIEAWRSMSDDAGAAATTPHLYGEATGFDLMPFAPTSENSILVLFGMLAQRMGFIVEAVRPQFPDCIAKRWDPKAKRYGQVLVEFELKAENFFKHQHPLGQKTVVVCWIDDLKERHDDLEIVSLKDYIRDFCRAPQLRMKS